MQINPDFNIGAYTIRAYEPGEIKVYTPISDEELLAHHHSGSREAIKHTTVMKQPFVIANDKLIESWQVKTPDRLVNSDFLFLKDLEVEILIVGTGKRMVFPDPQVHAYVHGFGTGLEIMTTEAACRTYNFLVSDQRSVAAALFMIEE